MKCTRIEKRWRFRDFIFSLNLIIFQTRFANIVLLFENEQQLMINTKILLEKRLGLAQLCLLLVVLIFMAMTRSASMGTALFDGTSTSFSSSDMIANVKRRSGLWRATRINSEPEARKVSSAYRSSHSLIVSRFYAHCGMME
jgi:hypothetical protein